MLVRDNKTTFCCGNKLFLSMEVLGMTPEYILMETTCRWCRHESIGYVPVTKAHETIRKGAFLFPTDSPIINYGFWPVENGPLSKARFIRVARGIKYIFAIYWFHGSTVTNPYFVELARRIHGSHYYITNFSQSLVDMDQ